MQHRIDSVQMIELRLSEKDDETNILNLLFHIQVIYSIMQYRGYFMELFRVLLDSILDTCMTNHVIFFVVVPYHFGVIYAHTKICFIFFKWIIYRIIVILFHDNNI